MLIAYSIFDKKVGSYMRPAFAKSVIEVQRSIEQSVKDKGSSLCLFPADFALYKVGSFDDEEGVFIFQSKPEFILEVVDYVNPLERKDVSNGR